MAIEEARSLLTSGKPESAIRILEPIVEANPDDAQMLQVYGIALAQTGRLEDAEAAFRRAIVLDPTDPEGFVNLAAHLFHMGDRVEASTLARETLKIKPDDARALAIVSQCQASFEAGGVPIAPTPEATRPGPDAPAPFVWNLGTPWTIVGWGLVILCSSVSLLLSLRSPFFLGSDRMPLGIRHDPISFLTVFAWIFGGLATAFWMIVDIIDRRLRFIWIVPLAACGLAGVHALPLLVYMLIGRRTK